MARREFRFLCSDLSKASVENLQQLAFSSCYREEVRISGPNQLSGPQAPLDLPNLAPRPQKTHLFGFPCRCPNLRLTFQNHHYRPLFPSSLAFQLQLFSAFLHCLQFQFQQAFAFVFTRLSILASVALLSSLHDPIVFPEFYAFLRTN